MGLDIKGKVVFGKVVSYSEFLETKKERGCYHDTDESKKFCSECGEPVWIEEKEFPLESDMSNELSYFYIDYENKEKVIVGFLLTKTPSNRNYQDQGFIQIPNPTPGMVEELKDFFSKFNVKTNDQDFQPHLFMNFSY